MPGMQRVSARPVPVGDVAIRITLILMEKEYSTITTDGRILQKDNAVFPGKELARVDPAEAEEALRYFSAMFGHLQEYAEAQLEAVKAEERGPELREKMEQLRTEVVSSKAVGDFETLVGKIDTVIRDCGQEQVPVSGSESAVGAGSEAQVPGDTTARLEETTREAGEGPPAGKAGESGEEPAAEEEDETYPEALAGLAALADKAREISGEKNWQLMQSELDNIRFKWDQIVDEEESLLSEPGYDHLVQKLESAQKKVSERKAEWLERRRERRKENVEKRVRILDQFQEIIDKKKWQAFKQVGNLNARWEEIKDLPKEPVVEEQARKFQELANEFNEKKVAFLVKKALKEEENLVGKLAILEKMEQIVASVAEDTTNWEQYDAQMEELSRQWRKIGHVPNEQSDEVWERFKAVRDAYFHKKMEYNKEFRAHTTKNIRKKTRLCELAEALLEEEDLAVAVREMNNLHKKWKKIGPVPKEKNDELWERFNEATHKFNEKKNENLDVIREQEQQNLNERQELCEKAEKLSDRTDWNEAAAEMDALMKAWKETGPVPRRKAGKIWKRFKKAMDTFYEKRRKHFRQVRDEQKENYEKKKQVVAELEKLGELEDAEEAVKQAKPLQEQFRKIGFVPIKKKSKIEKAYKEACDRIYQRARGAGRKAVGTARDARATADKSQKAEYFRLRKECDDLHEEIMRYQDTKTFINPGGKGNALIDEIQQKIDKTQEKLDKKQEKLEELRQKMED